MNQKLRPAYVPSPGRTLENVLERRGWTQRDLADITGRPIQAVNEIIRGTKQITPETAIELAAALGTTPEFWTNLETNYRLWKALQGQETREPEIARRSKLYELLPIAELMRRKWLPETSDLGELERAVCGFLGIASVDEKPRLSVAFRQAPDRAPEQSAQMAWVRRVEQLGRQQQVGRFDSGQLRAAMPSIVAGSDSVEKIAHIPALLNDLGVRFVIVRHLPRTYIDGAVCDLLGPNPIVALTLRYDRVDSFWFTLMHELMHLVLGHRDPHLDDLDDQTHTSIAQEQEANALAAQRLMNQPELEAFISHTRPFFGRNKVIQFAARQHVHPGIVVGQLQRRGELPYTHLRALLNKVSPYLTPWIDSPAAA
jgi:HTH-type transcriptional regulator / antitoxin HigA